jgi:hypothetical protein
MDRSDITLRKVIEDIKSGMGDVIIMEKYQISPSVLLRIKQNLSHSSAPHEPKSEVSLASEHRIKRRGPRYYVCYSIRTQDANNRQNVGTVNDISNQGIQVRGLTARVGQTLTLTVLGEAFHAHSSFSFEATCCWKASDDGGECVAGFAITKISPKDLQQLRKLIDELTVA